MFREISSESSLKKIYTQGDILDNSELLPTDQLICTFNQTSFNLYSEKSKLGRYIGKIDPDSPAESAGLCENDRIIEVNYAPIQDDDHKMVVTRIKEGVKRNGITYPDEVILHFCVSSIILTTLHCHFIITKLCFKFFLNLVFCASIRKFLP